MQRWPKALSMKPLGSVERSWLLFFSSRRKLAAVGKSTWLSGILSISWRVGKSCLILSLKSMCNGSIYFSWRKRATHCAMFNLSKISNKYKRILQVSIFGWIHCHASSFTSSFCLLSANLRLICTLLWRQAEKVGAVQHGEDKVVWIPQSIFPESEGA